MNIGPYMAYFCLYGFLFFIQKKKVLWVQNVVFMNFWCFLAILSIKMAEFSTTKKSVNKVVAKVCIYLQLC